MNLGFVSCTHEPRDVAAREPTVLFDGFEIGRGGAFLRVETWLSNVHFVESIFRRERRISVARDRAVTGSWDRSRPWNQGLGGAGLAQNIQVGRKTFNKDTKQSWLRS
jgi:hypothetical protein